MLDFQPRDSHVTTVCQPGKILTKHHGAGLAIKTNHVGSLKRRWAILGCTLQSWPQALEVSS